MDSSILTPILVESNTDNRRRIKKLQLIGEAALFCLMAGAFVEGLFSMTGLSPFDDSQWRFYMVMVAILVFTGACGLIVYCIVRKKNESDDSPIAPTEELETSPTEELEMSPTEQLETSPISPEDQA